MTTVNRCTRCKIKLSSRNKNKGTKAFYQLCTTCFSDPSDEERCTKIKSNGERCKFRLSHKSETLCAIHYNMSKR